MSEKNHKIELHNFYETLKFSNWRLYSLADNIFVPFTEGVKNKIRNFFLNIYNFLSPKVKPNYWPFSILSPMENIIYIQYTSIYSYMFFILMRIDAVAMFINTLWGEHRYLKFFFFIIRVPQFV